MEIFLAAFLRPFLLIVILIAIAWPLQGFIRRRMPDGRLKRLLLTRLN